MSTEKNSRLKKFLGSWLGLILLLVVFGLSLANVFHDHITYEAPDVKTLRICHWQLEAGFREAMQKLIDDYEELYLERTGERVHIVQVPIPGGAYSQYLNTSLIGDMAPDIIQMGWAETASSPSYVVRFFEALGDAVREPNPYNDGGLHAETPWKDTFFDAMAGGYDPTLLDYYAVPFSAFTVRLYYNRDLLESITGSQDIPKTYEDFLHFYEQTAAYNQKNTQTIFPMAGSKAQRAHLERAYFGPFAYFLTKRVDLDFNQDVRPEEAYIGYLQGKWNMASPEIMAYLKSFKEIAAGFQDGWMAAEGQDATFLFLQERAVMILTGSWEANGIEGLTRDKFALGVMEVPLPVDHPEYGAFVPGPKSESDLKGGVLMGLNKSSRHKDISIDFLRHCTSLMNNQQFCQDVNWLPVVIGSRPRDFLKPFLPQVNGYRSTFDWQGISTPVSLFRTGGEWSYMAGQLSREAFAERMKDVYEKSAAQGFREISQKNRLIERESIRLATGEIAAGCFSTEAERAVLNRKIAERIFNQQHKTYFRMLQMEMYNQATGGDPAWP